MANTIESVSGGGAQQVASAGPPLVREQASSLSAEGSSRVVANKANEPVAPPRADGPASKNSPSVDVAANFTALQQTKEQSNQVAQTVRQLEGVSSNIDKMTENLTQIVKMYPPYPKDSSQRAQLLNEVAGLRKLTDQLTVPPAYETMVNKVSDSPARVDVNSTDQQVADALSSLNSINASIVAESKNLYASGDTGGASGVGAELAAQQQSRIVANGLAATSQGVSSEAGKAIANTLTQ